MLVLHLFHGRLSSSQNLDDWGSDGPHLTGFTWLHVTYFATYCLGYKLPPAETTGYNSRVGNGDAWWMRDSMLDDCVYYDGSFYGDWDLYETSDPEELKQCVPFNPELAIIPKTKINED